MNLQSCLHPQRICNPYTGEWMLVPCRKCEACQSARSYGMETRLINESKFHKFCFFITLTYDEYSVPYVQVIREHDTPCRVVRYPESYYGSAPQTMEVKDYVSLMSQDGEIVEDIHNSLNVWDWSFSDYDYINRVADGNSFYGDNKLRVPCKRDLQLFMKRLRRKIEYKYGKENTKIRYFLCSELGPRCLRPHYHGILFVDSQDVAHEMAVLVHSCWAHGRTDCQLSKDKACGYVAKYICGSNCYPKVYELPQFRTVCLYSRCPSIGTAKDVDEEAKEIIFNEAHEVEFIKSSRIEVVPLWKSLENRFFPRCKKFNQRTHFDRVRMFKLYERFVTFRGSLDSDKQKLSVDLILPLFNQYLFNHGYNFEVSQSDLYISSRILKICRTYNVSVDWYVGRIERYYDTKAQEALKQQYQFQEIYSKNVHLGHVYKSFTPRGKSMSAFYLNDLIQISEILRRGDPLPLKYEYFLDSMEFPFSRFGDEFQVNEVIRNYRKYPSMVAFARKKYDYIRDTLSIKTFNDTYKSISQI